jgi:hypothetical protein
MLKSLIKPVFFLSALVGGSGMLLPEEFSVERSLEMHGLPEDLYLEVSDLASWQQWSPWSSEVDGGATYTLSNDPEGAGAFLRFKGPKLGRGEFRVLSVDEEAGVEINWIQESNRIARHSFVGTESPGKVRQVLVSWTFSGSLGKNPLLRWQAFLMHERSFGLKMEAALLRLRKRMKEL